MPVLTLVAKFDLRLDNIVCVPPDYKYTRSRWTVTYSNCTKQEINVEYSVSEIELPEHVAEIYNNNNTRFADITSFYNFIANNNFTICLLTCKLEMTASNAVASKIKVIDVGGKVEDPPKYKLGDQAFINDNVYTIVSIKQNKLDTYEYMIINDNGHVFCNTISIKGIVCSVPAWIPEENISTT